MRVLVLGSGAREHAIAARLAADPDVPALVAAPGNPGIGKLAELRPASLSDLDAIVDLARRERIDLTVVGPELPLSLGLVDRFDAEGLRIVGPTRAAAALESSKAFAKSFMERHRIPTARFRTCGSQAAAMAAIRSGEFAFPVVLKADGLAAGKGVVIASDHQDAEEAVLAAMSQKRFGAAGECLVIEECLSGPEVSFFALCDGERAMPIGTAQDHKRVFDDDRGPNTGGMGAFAPSPLVDAALHDRVISTIVRPVVRGMAREGHPFRGFLYAGLMLTVDGPKVIEFNVRLGDPEAQVVLPLIAEPLLPLLAASAEGRLPDRPCRLGTERLVGVVAAARGYPEAVDVGDAITGIDDAEALDGVVVYHAGTSARDGRVVTNGGRVLTVAGRGASFEEAIGRAYAGMAKITFAGMQFRRDIGRKALTSTS